MSISSILCSRYNKRYVYDVNEHRRKVSKDVFRKLPHRYPSIIFLMLLRLFFLFLESSLLLMFPKVLIAIPIVPGLYDPNTISLTANVGEHSIYNLYSSSILGASISH